MTDFFKTFSHVFLSELSKMWWFIFLSIIVAALIKTYQLDLKIRFLLQKKIKTGIVFATFAGMVSPLCSCGILPIAISLAVAGVPLPPLMSLLFTSPVMGPEALVITYGGLGEEFAIIKLVFSFIFGLMVGLIFYILQKFDIFTENTVRIKPLYDERGELKPSYDIACANEISIKTMKVEQRPNKFLFFMDRFKDMGFFIGSLTLLAIVIESLMFALFSADTLKSILNYHGFISVLATVFIGALVPLNQIAAVPIIKGLLSLGMSKASAVALMFSGPVVSIPSAVVLIKIFKPSVSVVYFIICIMFSLIAGLIFI
ncbi:MAG: hypothetical protein OHK0040_10180 [bacterium]